MPNWCTVLIEFEGPENEINDIVASDLDFEKIIPIPKELNEIDSHDWRIINWGTKWNPTRENKHNETTILSPTKMHVKLITAWDLPMGILKHISSTHPQTIVKVIDCEDEGGWFVGSCKILRGVVLENNIHMPSKEELRIRGMLCDEG